MIITGITIENFKGIREPVHIDFRPITLLFGPNSAGKSTILQALHYAYEIFERGNVDPGTTIIGGKAVDLGGFESLVHNHDLSRKISMVLDIDFNPYSLPTYYISETQIEEDSELADFYDANITYYIDSATVKIGIEWSHLFQKPIVTEYEVQIEDTTFARINASKDSKQVILSFLDIEHPKFIRESWRQNDEEPYDGEYILEALSYSIQPERMDGNNFNLGIVSQKSALPVWGQPIKFQDEIWKETGQLYLFKDDYEKDARHTVFSEIMSRILVGCGEMVKAALLKTNYIGPLRDVPSRNYSPARYPDKTRWSNGIAAWDIISNSDKDFINKINNWLSDKDLLNTGYTVSLYRYSEIDIESHLMMAIQRNSTDQIDEDYQFIKDEIKNLPIKSRLTLRDEYNDIEVLPQDIGVGISQIMPIVVGALFFKRGILAIEQPELHIHPALQVALGDLFLSRIKEKNICYLLETHSEHLLLRLLRRIRETHEFRDSELKPDFSFESEQIAIYYIENTPLGVQVNLLKIDETGEFEVEWPNGFFEEREDELLY